MQVQEDNKKTKTKENEETPQKEEKENPGGLRLASGMQGEGWLKARAHACRHRSASIRISSAKRAK